MGDIYGKHGNGDIFVKNSSNSPVLPLNTSKSEVYGGSIEVLESKHSFNNKSEVRETIFHDELGPDRPFHETLTAIKKDPRLDLACETYIQMILGKGFRVTATKDSISELVNDWLERIGFDEMLEDGLYSYLGTGNWIVEKSPDNKEFVEIPITTMASVDRTAKGKIKRYVQHVNNKDIFYKPDEIIHFKLTNVARESFARGLFHSILSDYQDPRTGITYDSPLIQMKEIEDAMAEIFKGNADPTTMFYFADAGEQFIKTQADNLKKMKKGSKIVTDKQFEVKVIEASNGSKYDGYIEHMQRDLLEPGSKFPLQFFNAGFTARASSESTDSVLIRKVKRIQKRLADQIKRMMIIPFLEENKKSIKLKDLQAFFETPIKQEVTVTDTITAFRDNIIRRSEARKWFIENTTVAKFIDQEDMVDEPPITSVTPTNQMTDNREEEEESIHRKKDRKKKKK